MKKLLIVFLLFAFSLNTTNAWLGLIAQSGDILNVAKWNELVNNKLSIVNLKAGTGISLSNSGDDIFINSESALVPFISNTTQISIPDSATSTISLKGYNFTPNSTLQIPGFDGTVDSINVISPVKLEATLTTGSNTSDYDLVISNAGILNTGWSGNGFLLLHVGEILGTGTAGTYLEDFESGMGSWVSSGLTGDWTRDDAGTPSSNTGPDDGAGASTWYVYTEVSSGADSNEFGIETDDFRHATKISLDYHMYGSDMGTIYIQTLFDGTWTTVWSISGEQQSANTDNYINTGDIDLTGYDVEKIRILMNGASGYRGDATVDNISITSD